MCSGQDPAVGQDGPATEMRALVLQGNLSRDTTSLTDAREACGWQWSEMFIRQSSTSGNQDTILITEQSNETLIQLN